MQDNDLPAASPKQTVLVLQKIRDLILQGVLASGERLTEAGLAERLGSSRTPIRQALPSLAKEGLLVATGKRGFAVRSFSAQECLDAIRLRAALEGLAARSLAERGCDAATLQRFEDILLEGDAIFAKRSLSDSDEAAYGAMNARFHALLIEGAGNELLAELVARCHVVPFVSPSTIAFDRNDLQSAFDLLSYAHRQHHAIVDAIRRRDGSRAEFLLREHAVTQEVSMNFGRTS
jgi:GntR family transcriptional regulator of vanillate catabolism